MRCIPSLESLPGTLSPHLPNERSGYDTKQSDDWVPVMLEL